MLFIIVTSFEATDDKHPAGTLTMKTPFIIQKVKHLHFEWDSRLQVFRPKKLMRALNTSRYLRLFNAVIISGESTDFHLCENEGVFTAFSMFFDLDNDWRLGCTYK